MKSCEGVGKNYHQLVSWSFNLCLVHIQVKYLDKVSILDALLAEEKKQVANALVEMHFASEDRIIQQGEPGNMCHGRLGGSGRVTFLGENCGMGHRKIFEC